MARYLLLSVLLLAVSCSEEDGANERAAEVNAGSPTQSAGDAALLDDSDCNLQTVLEEGIPGSPGNLIKSDRNPNGESELAHLMRVFVDQLRDARLLVEAGEQAPPLFPTHRKMRCAWPTNPSERDEAYDGRAQTYLTTVRAFDAAPSQQTYNAIITTCVACHQVSCSGVCEFIEGLRWQ